MPRKKKVLFTLMGLLFCLICVFCIKDNVYASGLIGTESSGEYLFNKYPIENYMPDSYVSSDTHWWNVGENISNGAFSLLSFLVGCVYVAIFFFFNIIGYLVQMIYSADAISPLLDKAVEFIQNVSGFNGGFLQNGLFTQLLGAVVIITGVYYGFMIIKKETGRTIGGLGVFCLLIIVSLGFFWKADTFITGANNIASSIQATVVRAGTNALGMDEDPAVAIREGFFDITVFKPYLLLQYGDTSISAREADKILKHESGSEEREAQVKKEVEENGNKMMSGFTGLKMRITYLFPLLFSSIILAIVLAFMVSVNIYHQISFLVYCCMSPFVLIMSLLPGRSQVAVKLGSKLLYELCMRIGLALLMCLMYGFSNAVFEMAELVGGGYMLGAIFQSILYVVIFLFRNKIYELFMVNGKPAKNRSLGNMVGAAYLASRGVKAFNAIRGNRPPRPPRPPRRSTKPGDPGTGMATIPQRSRRTDASKPDPGDNALTTVENSNVTSRDGGQRRQRNKQIPTTKRSNRNGGYRASTPINRPTAQFSRNFDSSKYRVQRTASGVNPVANRVRKNPALIERRGGYHAANRKNVPRVRSGEWKNEKQLYSRNVNKENHLQSRNLNNGGSAMEQKRVNGKLGDRNYRVASRNGVPVAAAVKVNKKPESARQYHTGKNLKQRSGKPQGLNKQDK